MKKISWVLMFALTSCATWNEEFEGEVERGYPKASIHKINTMVDKGQVKDAEEESAGDYKSFKVFKDGHVSRGAEEVRRMYVMTYEDASGNLHMAHHLYLVVKPATWIVDGQSK
ncbi:MAG: TraV family lipoprotein [Alphaproteobacteria bacterium]|nr:TraV family lipoprotein [Alphaproteobacteria bacterium]